ncbi:medium chain dehydrogenase/reductase family protein [Microlunatus panaciterrae]|uniref:NADPH:quinone reductase-like Zn-dependent oxidoreductase n=1 Tax=Microlunatus panaciterrae TaxID=400768 RepID=A0ABS2RPH0_9ACTN|nr:medium chain dehydrogenase/reductase family protein [Microlunatus panaciterrae]MBM7799834.1 NADPH:quinone reductase-like Zn-dependent oxidoreductase [Microlunatus panaciterrae]
MKAVVLTRTGGPEVLEVREWPTPAVGAGEVRIAVRAAGLNFADTMARVGLYPATPDKPCVLGYEVAGVVEALGADVTGFSVGQRVMAGTRFGGQAELATARARDVFPMPDALSFEQGAAFCVNYGTAYAALIIMGGLREDTRVLIHAAAGGVGIAATQIARNVGAEIFGTASAAKHAALRANGVHHPIDYHTQDFQAEVRRLTSGEGVDVVMDAMGPTSFRKDYRILRPGGRLIMFGLSEALNEDGRSLRAAIRGMLRIPTSTMPWWNAGRLLNQNRGVFGLNLLSWWRREGGMDRITSPLLADLASGRLSPVIAKSFPFARAADAHRYLAERRNIGKVVLTPV